MVDRVVVGIKVEVGLRWRLRERVGGDER